MATPDWRWQAICHSQIEGPGGKLAPCGWKGEVREGKDAYPEALKDARRHGMETRREIRGKDGRLLSASEHYVEVRWLRT